MKGRRRALPVGLQRWFWSLQSASWDDAIGPAASLDRVDDVVRRVAKYRKSPGRLLDLGGGTASIAFALAERGHEVTMIDFSRGMLRQARKKLRHGAPPVKLLRTDLNERLPFAAARFDTAICISALQCVGDPRAVLAEVRRVLVEDGLLFLRVKSDPGRGIDPGDRSPAGRLFSPLKRWASGAGFARPFSLEELLDMCREAGLVVEDHEEDGPWLSLVARTAPEPGEA